jgi:hypothetical protein
MKRWIAVLAMMLAMAPMCGAQADEAAKEAKVRDLFVAMHMEKMMAQMMDAVMGMVTQMVDSTPGTDQLTPEQKKLVDDFQAKAVKLATDSMGWQALEPEYVKLYAKTYTMEELDGIVVFYKSAAGQAMLAKTPQLTTGSMQIAQERMQILQPQIKALQDQFLKDLRATAPQGKKTSPPSY